MTQKKKNPLLRAFGAGLILAVVSAFCIFAVLHEEHQTHEIIAKNQNAKMEALFDTLLPPDVRAKTEHVTCKLVSHKGIGKKMRAYIATDANDEKIGYVMLFSTSRGYTDPLILIAGLTQDYKLYRVDVALSKETPGIGDKVERRKSDFLEQFNLQSLESKSFEVKKFGGDFDYITGATVTSRAIVLASSDLLENVKDVDFDTLPLCK